MRIVVVFSVLMLAACGGRVARPVAETKDFDHLLSCGHIRAEFQVNHNKLTALTGEREEKIEYNLGIVLLSPFFLDTSDTLKKEAEAAYARNARLVELNDEKGCPGLQDPTEPAEATGRGYAPRALH